LAIGGAPAAPRYQDGPTSGAPARKPPTRRSRKASRWVAADLRPAGSRLAATVRIARPVGAGAPCPGRFGESCPEEADSKEGYAHPRAVNPARDTGRRLHRAGLPGAGCASLAAVAAAICRCGVALILPPPALNRRRQISQHARRNYRDSRSARPIDYGQASLERAEDGLFFARRGAFAFPYRRAGGAPLSAGAAYTRDVEEAAHHAEVISPTFGRAASTGLARC
jgi:hypothetical protein